MMVGITVALADNSSRSRWDHYVAGHNESEAYHLYAWRHVLESALGCACYYLQARAEDGTVRGVLPLAHLKSRLFGNFLVSIPAFNYCGVLADDETVREALLDGARELGASLALDHIELRHRDNLDVDLPYRADKVAMRLSLPPSEEELWQGFKPKLRAQIRRPSKDGAQATAGSVELLDEFYDVFSRNMRDLGTPVYPKTLFREMCRQFPDEVRVHVVRLEDKPVAAGITVAHKGSMEIPFASSLREFNRSSVNMLLYWSVLCAAIAAGCTVFDFGRSTPDTGTYRFKAQWGAHPQPLHWHYWLRDAGELPMLNPQNPKFRFATQVWSRLPVAVANLLGPRIVRHLP